MKNRKYEIMFNLCFRMKIQPQKQPGGKIFPGCYTNVWFLEDYEISLLGGKKEEEKKKSYLKASKNVQILTSKS